MKYGHDKTVLGLVKSEQGRTALYYSTVSGIDRTTVSCALRMFCLKGLMRREKKTAQNGLCYHYFLTDYCSKKAIAMPKKKTIKHKAKRLSGFWSVLWAYISGKSLFVEKV